MIKRCIPGYTLHPRGDHYQVRRVGMTRKRLKTDPAFASVRKHNKEFGAASRLAAAICQQLFMGKQVKGAARSLTLAIMNIVRDDSSMLRGQRSLFTAGAQQLAGLDLNPAITWEETTTLPFRFQPASGTESAAWMLPAHKPTSSLAPPGDATHYRFLLSAICVSKAGEITHTGWQRSSRFPLKALTISATTIQLPVNAAAYQQVWWIGGIEWYSINQITAGPFRLIEITEPFPYTK